MLFNPYLVSLLCKCLKFYIVETRTHSSLLGTEDKYKHVKYWICKICLTILFMPYINIAS